MTAIQARVELTVVGTVTYGNRVASCQRTIKSAIDAGASEFIVLTNGLSRRNVAELKASVSTFKCVRFRFIEVRDNEGSAAGFGKVISTFLNEYTARHSLLLLDDDNILEGQSLQGGLLTLEEAGFEKNCVALYRPDDRAQRGLVEEGSFAGYNLPGTFLWFDLASWIKHRLARDRRDRSNQRMTRPTAVPSAPFGGLLIPAPIARQAGLPRADFVLYQDDTEYTERIIKMGFAILLDPKTRVRDNDERVVPSVASRGGIASLLQRYSTSTDFRLYYTIRNCSYLDKERAHTCKTQTRFTVNCGLYLFALLCISAPRRRYWRPCYSALRAIAHGFRGKLGSQVTLALEKQPAETE